jgi:intracellular septation protein A
VTSERPSPLPQSFEELFGGARGLVDSGLPPVVFVLVNAWRGLDVAVGAAVAVGAILLNLRLVRREPVRHAVSGFLGVLIAAGVAKALGSAEGFFVPGIALNGLYAVVFLGSVLIRRPVLGALFRTFGQHSEAYYSHPLVRRAYAEVTLLWAAVFVSRVVVQTALVRAGRPGWLAATKLAMGLPLTFVALALTPLWVARRTRSVEDYSGDPSPADTSS